MKKLLLFVTTVAFALEIGKGVPHLILDGKDGGRIDGKPFDTKILEQKVYLFIYADPDKKGLNSKFFDDVKALRLQRARYGSIAVINMAATWKPNFIISTILKSKQKRYPDTVYVKDYKKIFVKRWGLADDDMNILIFDHGKLLFQKSGKMSDEEQRKALKLLKEAVGDT